MEKDQDSTKAETGNPLRASAARVKQIGDGLFVDWMVNAVCHPEVAPSDLHTRTVFLFLSGQATAEELRAGLK